MQNSITSPGEMTASFCRNRQLSCNWIHVVLVIAGIAITLKEEM
jgi:hypothetical protein